MRLFVAITLPPEAKKQLSQVQAVLRSLGDGSFPSEQLLHLTLAFLGQTNNTSGAKRALEAVTCAPFELTIQTLGKFGSLYWAGCAPSEPLNRLQRELCQQLRLEGFLLEGRPFRPHLTLCRRYRPFAPLNLSGLAEALGSISVGVESVSLMRSERIDGRLQYTPLVTHPLLG